MKPHMEEQRVEGFPAGPATTRRGSQLRQWFDRRTGLNGLLREALDKPIPGGARLAYIFGSGLLFIFISQVITGIFLSLYYVPSADHAHTTVAYITKAVAAGSFVRSVHVYGASAMVIILFLHLGQTFLYGAYKGRRELLWISGTVLFVLVLGMAFTGYLLPWDEKAYFATAVGTNLPNEIPVVGNWVKEVMRGGTELGTLTISRFFAAHVFFLPGLIFFFVAIHIYLFRKAGAAGPTNENPFKPRLPGESLYPRHVIMDLIFALLVVIALGVLAHFLPAPLGPKVNPADTQFLLRPEWYYRPFFQWLKYWHGRTVLVGVLLVPLIIAALFVGLPFYDRRVERRPSRRPLAIAVFALIMGGLVFFGGASYYEDAHDPAVARQLALQRQEMEKYMRSPFRAEVSGTMLATSSPGVAAAAGSPLAIKGREIFASHSCGACHGENGGGGPIAGPLTGIGSKYTPEQLLARFDHPSAAMDAGGMPHFQFTLEDVKALMRYLDSAK